MLGAENEDMSGGLAGNDKMMYLKGDEDEEIDLNLPEDEDVEVSIDLGDEGVEGIELDEEGLENEEACPICEACPCECEKMGEERERGGHFDNYVRTKKVCMQKHICRKES